MSAQAGRRTYLKVWAGLAVLTVVEIAWASAPVGRAAVAAGLLALGLWKALLVALHFMHLKSESPWLKAAAAVPALVTAITVLLILTDTPMFGL